MKGYKKIFCPGPSLLHYIVIFPILYMINNLTLTPNLRSVGEFIIIINIECIFMLWTS